MAQWCDYQTQLDEMAGLVADRIGAEWDIAFQSRSGPPHVPWLEPDVNDHLRTLAEQGVSDVTLMPLGFIAIIWKCSSTSTSRRPRRPRPSVSTCGAPHRLARPLPSWPASPTLPEGSHPPAHPLSVGTPCR